MFLVTCAAICVAPALVGSKDMDANPLLSLSLAKFAVTLLEKSLSNYILNGPPEPRDHLLRRYQQYQEYYDQKGQQENAGLTDEEAVEGSDYQSIESYEDENEYSEENESPAHAAPSGPPAYDPPAVPQSPRSYDDLSSRETIYTPISPIQVQSSPALLSHNEPKEEVSKPSRGHRPEPPQRKKVALVRTTSAQNTRQGTFISDERLSPLRSSAPTRTILSDSQQHSPRRQFSPSSSQSQQDQSGSSTCLKADNTPASKRKPRPTPSPRNPPAPKPKTEPSSPSVEGVKKRPVAPPRPTKPKPKANARPTMQTSVSMSHLNRKSAKPKPPVALSSLSPRSPGVYLRPKPPGRKARALTKHPPNISDS